MKAEEVRREREKEAQISALRQIRDDLYATPGERLEAIKMIAEIEKEHQEVAGDT